VRGWGLGVVSPRPSRCLRTLQSHVITPHTSPSLSHLQPTMSPTATRRVAGAEEVSVRRRDGREDDPVSAVDTHALLWGQQRTCTVEGGWTICMRAALPPSPPPHLPVHAVRHLCPRLCLQGCGQPGAAAAATPAGGRRCQCRRMRTASARRGSGGVNAAEDVSKLLVK
jgi:hypothetical protein